MKYLTTSISKEEIIKILETNPITPNSLCVVCLNSGASIVINDHISNDELLKATGKFYEIEMSDHGWALIQKEGEYSILGDSNLCPVKLL